MRNLLIALAATLLIAGSAAAQFQPAPVYQAFAPTAATQSVSVTNSSAATSLGTYAPTIIVQNTGANAAYVKLGDMTATASASTDYPVLPGQSIALAPTSTAYTYIAAVTASSTTTLVVTPGLGNPTSALNASSGGGSSTVTVSNLPTTVDTNSGAAGASTLRVVTATNSPVQLAPGANIAGKVGIDQTTPGTTNGIVVNSSALPAGAATSAPTAALYNTGSGNNGIVGNGNAALTLATTELNALSTNGLALSQVGGTAGLFSQTNTGSFRSCIPTLTLGAAISSAVNSGAVINIWFLQSTDGSTGEWATAAGSTNSSTSLTSVTPFSGLYYNSTTPSLSDYVFDITHPSDLAVGTFINAAVSSGTVTISPTAAGTHAGDTLYFVKPPARFPDIIFPLNAQTYPAGYKITAQGKALWPAQRFFALVQNLTGQAIPSGSTLACAGMTDQHQ